MHTHEFISLIGHHIVANRQDYDGDTDTFSDSLTDSWEGDVIAVYDERRSDHEQNVIVDLGAHGTFAIDLGEVSLWRIEVS